LFLLKQTAKKSNLTRTMAEKTNSSASWADVVNQLVTSFSVLRDIFGYALPGLVFLGIGILSHRITLQALHDLLTPYNPPWWALVALLVAAAYAIGHILASIAYMRIDAWKALLYWRKSPRLDEHPTEVSALDLYYKHFYPELFAEKNRRETMAVLTFSLMAALLLGWVVFCWLTPTLCEVLFWSGVALFVDTLTTMSHLRRVREAAQKAGADIKAAEAAAPGTVSPDLKAVLDAIQQAAGNLGKKPPAG
jgi:hypothetical protein